MPEEKSSGKGQLTAALLREFWALHYLLDPFVFLSTDIEHSWAELWKSNFDLNPDLHLPAENKYIGQ